MKKSWYFNSKNGEKLYRLPCLLLVMVMILGLALFPVIGGAQTSPGSGEEGAAGYRQLLSRFASDDEMIEIITQLHEWGIMGDDGELNFSQSIIIGGLPFTLDEVREQIEAGADLSSEVYVGTTRLTLGDIDTMLQIEAEAELIQEVLGRDVTLTEEHYQSMLSLMDQLQNAGLPLTVAVGEADDGLNPSIRMNASISAPYANGIPVSSLTGGFQDVTVTVSMSNTAGWDSAKYPVSFSWRLLPGSAAQGVHYDYRQTFNEQTQIMEDEGPGLVTLTADNPSATIGFTVYKPDQSALDTRQRWNGERIFALQLYDAHNALFAAAAGEVSPQDADNTTLKIALSDTYRWRTFETSGSSFVRDLSAPFSLDTGYGQIENCQIDLDDILYYDAKEIYYDVNERLSSIHAFDIFNGQTAYLDYNIGVSSASYLENAFDPPLKGGQFDNYYLSSLLPLLYAEEQDEKNYTISVAEAEDNGYYKQNGSILGNLDNYRTYNLTSIGGSIWSNSSTARRYEISKLIVEPEDGVYKFPKYFGFRDIYLSDYYYSTYFPLSTAEPFIRVRFDTWTTSLHDKTPPTVLNVEAPAGEYSPGQVIPITVTFSEPIDLSNVMIQVNPLSEMVEGKSQEIPNSGVFLRCQEAGQPAGQPGQPNQPRGLGYPLSNQGTFFYTVQSVDDPFLLVKRVINAKDQQGAPLKDKEGNILLARDIMGNVLQEGADDLEEKNTNNGLGWTLNEETSGLKIVSARLIDGFAQVELDKSAYVPADSSGLLTLQLYAAEAFQENFANDRRLIYVDEGGSLKQVGISQSLYASCNGLNFPLFYTYDDTDKAYTLLSGEFTLPAVPALDSETYTVTLYRRQGLSKEELDLLPESELLAPGGGLLLFGKSASLIRQNQPYVAVSDLKLLIYKDYASKTLWDPAPYIIYPSDDIVLSYEYSGANILPPDTFRLQSSNNSVVELVSINDPLNPQAMAVKINSTGSARFSLICTDGGGARLDSEEFTVWNSGDPYIRIPAALNTLTVYKGQDSTVNWSTNIIDYYQKQTPPTSSEFKIELFNGQQTESSLGGLTPIYKNTLTVGPGDDPCTSFTIPGAFITALSVGNTPSYTVSVSALNPNNPAATLFALAYIQVISQPAQVAITRPTSLYLLDNSGPLSIEWLLNNIDINGAAAEFTIQKGNTTLVSQTLADMQPDANEAAAFSGSYTLQPTTVKAGELKEIYQVYLKAQNASDDGWSYDSFVLYVYNHQALQILVDGQAATALNMSNQQWAKANENIFSGMSAEDINALRRELYLRNMISANYHTYDWNSWQDNFSWSSSQPEVATVNYRQYSLYSPLDAYPYDVYVPSTQFALSGLKDGQTTIKAVHAATGMESTLNVSVQTLSGSFFIFQFSPLVKTNMYYQNGQGEIRVVSSNEQGSLALYEPEGIAGDISLAAKDENGDLWLGTIFDSTLRTGEKDSTLLQLYPLNTCFLHRATTADIYLKTENGAPYFGRATVRGGVYKNGEYLGNLGMMVNTDRLEDKTYGEEGATVYVGNDGRLSVNFFPEELGEIFFNDQLQFIFEIQFANDTYRPEIVYVNGNMNYYDRMVLGDTTLRLTLAEGKNPFLASQRADYHLPNKRLSSFLGYSGYVGPGSNYPQLDIYSTMLLWGIDITGGNLDYTVSFKDNFNITPGAQTQRSQVIVYPFSTIAIVENVLMLENSENKRTLWWEKDDYKARRMTMELYDPTNKNVVLQSSAMSWSVVDMYYLERVDESRNVALLLDTLNISSKVTNALGEDLSFIGGIAEWGVGRLARANVDTAPFKMLIGPTQNPAEFDAYIWAGINGPAFEENSTGIYMEGKAADIKANFIPGLGDMKSVAKENSWAGTLKPLANAKDQWIEGVGFGCYDRSNDSVSPKFHLNGYFEAKLRFNFDTGQWECFVMGGGFSMGAGVEITYTFNGQAGPVPVTAYIKAFGYLTVDFNTAVRYSELPGLPWEAQPVYSVSGLSVTPTGEYAKPTMVNDYLTSLRINGYVRAFGGIGRDMTIVAFRIGLFGQLDVDFMTKFLNREYLENGLDANGQPLRKKNGQYLDLKGQVGIEFNIKFAFFDITAVLVSIGVGNAWNFNEWQNINDYWAKNSQIGRNLSPPPAAALAGADAAMEVVSYSGVRLENRDYLSRNTRKWYSPGSSGYSALASLAGPSPAPGLSTAAEDGLTLLQDNAYPYSSPRLSRDGELLLYLSDGDSTNLADTEVCWSKKTANAYPQGLPLDTAPAYNSYGITGLQLDGDKDGAAAVWVRQGADIGKGAGESVSEGEQMLLLNSSEIMAARYNGSVWTVETLTDNASPNLAPVVATDGLRVLVAWRNVYSSDPALPLNFDNDAILYRIYDGNAWSETHTLYNGSAGTVYGLSAAMLPQGGNMALAYAINTADDLAPEGLEIVYAVIEAASGLPLCNMQLTGDSNVNENPQLIAVDFGQNSAHDYRLVLGWHSLGDYADIRLASFDGQGILDSSFIDSLSFLAASGRASFSNNFRFAKMNGVLNNIDNLALLWPEPANLYQVNSDDPTEAPVDSDLLLGVKFLNWQGQYVLSAPQLIADMANSPAGNNAGTIVDEFDAYLSGADQLSTVILASEYNSLRVIDGRNGQALSAPLTGLNAQYNVYVPQAESKLFNAAAAFAGAATLSTLYVDYSLVFPKSLLPLQFTVTNSGARPINSLTVDVGEGPKQMLSAGQSVLPNEACDCLLDHRIGELVQDFVYTIDVQFAGGGTQQISGTAHLEVYDIGISRVEVVREENGWREVEVTLYNRSSVPLAGSGTIVRLGVYEDAQNSLPSPFMSNGSTALMTFKYDDELALIDAGAFTTRFTFNARSYVSQRLSQGASYGEIPDNGIWLYLKAWLEDAGGSALPEYYIANNTSYVEFDSLLKRYGSPFTLEANYAASRAFVTVRNNNLFNSVSVGYLVVSLLDENGQTVASQAVPMNASMEGEESYLFTVDFPFSPLYVRAVASLSEGAKGEGNADLEILTFDGIPLGIEDYKNSDTVTYYNYHGDLRITAIPSVQGATVTINGQSADDLVAIVNIPGGALTEITVEVTAPDGLTKRNYKLRIDNTSVNVTLSQTGTYVFPAALEGYNAPDPLTVTLTNAGTADAEDLDVMLSVGGEAYFVLDKSALKQQLSGTDATVFTITPQSGLPLGDYTATLVVSGARGLNESFELSFSVTDGYTYEIAVEYGGDFADIPVTLADSLLQQKTVTVRNVGTGSVSGLKVSLSGADAAQFVLNSAAMATALDSGAATSFTLKPVDGISEYLGTYTVTVTVTGDNKISESFNISCTVTDQPTFTYSIELAATAPSLELAEGYSAGMGSQDIMITNTGTGDVQDLIISKTGQNADCFNLDTSQLKDILSGYYGQTVCYLAPVSGLAAGVYTVTLTVTAQATDGSTQVTHSIDITLTVTGATTDDTPPEGQIIIGANSWNSFWHTVTFGLFSKNTQSVTIEAADDSGEEVIISYYLSPYELTLDQVKVISGWISYSAAFNIDLNHKYIIYAKLSDSSGNTAYINSAGLVLYSDSTAITSGLSYTRGAVADQKAEVELNGNTINAILCGAAPLNPGADYSVSGGQITFKAAWLESLAVGNYLLTIYYDPQGEAYPNDPLEGSEAPASSTIALNLTVAQFYTVTFDLNGGVRNGGGDTQQTVPAGGAAIAPTVSRSGYIFNGWNSTFTAVYANITVTAQWTPIRDRDRDRNSTAAQQTTIPIPITEPQTPLAETISFAAFIQGFEDNTFRGDDLITREQFVTILFRLKNTPPLPTADRSNPGFKDVAPTRWSYDAIAWALKAGIIFADSQGNFRPAEALTRAEMAVMLVKAENLTELTANTFSDLADHPHRDDILKALAAKIFTGYPDGSFKPEGATSRNEAIAALVRYLLGGEPSDTMWQNIHLTFSDVPGGQWANKYIALAVQGYEGIIR